MIIEIEYSRKAIDDLKRFDVKITQRIIKKVKWFCSQSDPLRYASALSGVLSIYSRFRVGDYRVVFKLEDDGQIKIVMVVRVQHRREAYL